MTGATYFPYHNRIEDWQCPVCRDDTPNGKGGTVAHLGGGELHPVHRMCALSWPKSCPTCLIETDVHQIRLFSDLIHRPPFSSSNQVILGLVCMLGGLKWKSRPLSAIGLFVQFAGLTTAIQYHHRLPSVQTIETAAQRCLDALKRGYLLRFQIDDLKNSTRFHPVYRKMVKDWINSRDSNRLREGLHKVVEKAHYFQFAKRIVLIWRLCALAGSLYYAFAGSLRLIDKSQEILKKLNAVASRSLN